MNEELKSAIEALKNTTLKECSHEEMMGDVEKGIGNTPFITPQILPPISFELAKKLNLLK